MSASAARIVSREGVYIALTLEMGLYHWEVSIIPRIPTLHLNVLLHSLNCLLTSLHIPRWNLLSSSLLTMERISRKISLTLEEEKLFLPTVLQMFIPMVPKTFVLVVLRGKISLSPSLNLPLVPSLSPLKDSV